MKEILLQNSRKNINYYCIMNLHITNRSCKVKIELMLNLVR